jgi:AcrR family transcriptional regulator
VCQNVILMAENAIPSDDLAARIAGASLSKRGLDYTAEVRRLLDAGLEVMQRGGTAARPRVADIVAAAGLSNDAFYRHFPSKDALVAAIIEDGAERLRSYLQHQMAKDPTPEGQVRIWVDGVLAQSRGDVAPATLAVLWNAGGVGDGIASGHSRLNPRLAEVLHEPLAALGSADPGLDATLLTHAVVGSLSDHLWQRTTPSTAEVDHLMAFCFRAVGVRQAAATG